MKKYIFLDIDGVIATPQNIEEGLWGLTPDCQERLGKIIEATNAQIVLSSSWRHNDLDSTVSFMLSKGFLFCGRLIGVTIRAYHCIDKRMKVHLSIPRGVEIKQWIDTHIHSDNGKDLEYKKEGVDFTYVILDDDSDMLLEHKDNFIQTDGEIGLTDINVSQAISILNFLKDTKN